MSSTTDRSSERGQTLPIFALTIVVLLGFAALAFDGGQMLLDRRTEQNGADAAALAGARYVPTSRPSAIDEAMRVAYQNGYGAGPTSVSNGVTAANGTTVTVQVPPGSESAFFGQPGYIEVQIASSRPSIFGGVLGFLTQRAGALATASNKNGAAANYSMIALNPTQCQAANFAGTGTVTVAGNIQVDSNATCPQGAFNAGGTSTVQVTAPSGEIDVVGDATCGGHSSCTPTPSTSQPFVPDPLASLAAPGVPTLPTAMVQVAGTIQTVPVNCPGGTAAATAAQPGTCAFPSSYAGTTWLMSPGYYPGGISVNGGTIFMKPGLYYIGGGGLNVAGVGANLYSVSATWTGSTAPTSCTQTNFADCGGILIYNTDDPSATSGGATVKDMQPISLNGSASLIHLYPIQDAGPYTNIVIFQDRSLPASSSGDLQLNGNGANLYVQGTIYEPNGYVAIQGTGNLGPSQIIADTFSVTGSGSLSIGYNADLVARLIAVGLVE